MKNIHNHFSKIAYRYRDLRTTDLEPTLFIKKKLQKHPKIAAADIGCGEGRYDLKLFQYLGKKLFLYCCDVNMKMLKQLKTFLEKHKIRNFKTIKALARKIPLKDNSLDCIFTFNAVHHFKILQFLKESSRILKDGGYLFIYTRLRSQNRRNVWGKYFLLFNEKETRLYELNELKNLIKKTSLLKIKTIEYFKYNRLSSLDWLLEQAQNHHYSTFYLYTKKEFENSLEKFKQNVQLKFKDLNKINWFDENILLIVQKEVKQYGKM
ncbi:class I SAM-dependent methyltransferase [Candidatus Woesearchaeota archaeon]|nr:class I SAM-dependent methyltransferase [Candidatus Woesearchaeota archaeon]